MLAAMQAMSSEALWSSSPSATPSKLIPNDLMHYDHAPRQLSCCPSGSDSVSSEPSHYAHAVNLMMSEHDGPSQARTRLTQFAICETWWMITLRSRMRAC